MFCKNCGNKLNYSDSFCSSCGIKQEIQNLKLNEISSKKIDKLIKILSISAGVLFGLAGVILISGVLLCFPDPNEIEASNSLSYDIFGICGGSMIVISVILFILVVILNVIKINRNKRSC